MDRSRRLAEAARPISGRGNRVSGRLGDRPRGCDFSLKLSRALESRAPDHGEDPALDEGFELGQWGSDGALSHRGHDPLEPLTLGQKLAVTPFDEIVLVRHVDPHRERDGRLLGHPAPLDRLRRVTLHEAVGGRSGAADRWHFVGLRGRKLFDADISVKYLPT